MEGQQAWIQQQQQQQQQRFPMEAVGARLPAPGPGGEIRFQGPPGTFPPQPQAQAGPQTVAQGRSITSVFIHYCIYLEKGLLFDLMFLLGQGFTCIFACLSE
jgi:hypothetical protein